MLQKLSIQEIVANAAAIDAKNSLAVIPTNLGNKALKSRVHYAAGFLNQIGSNGNELLLTSQPASTGVKSIDKNQLASGMDFLCVGVRFLFDTTASVQTNGLATAIWASKAPANFKNGEVRISQNGDLLNVSGTAVTNFEASTGNDDDFLAITPVILRAQTPISIIVLLGAAAAADQAYKIELVGYDLTDPSKA